MRFFIFLGKRAFRRIFSVLQDIVYKTEYLQDIRLKEKGVRGTIRMVGSRAMCLQHMLGLIYIEMKIAIFYCIFSFFMLS